MNEIEAALRPMTTDLIAARERIAVLEAEVRGRPTYDQAIAAQKEALSFEASKLAAARAALQQAVEALEWSLNMDDHPSGDVTASIRAAISAGRKVLGG